MEQARTVFMTFVRKLLAVGCLENWGVYARI
jgi:hypothetical protein